MAMCSSRGVTQEINDQTRIQFVVFRFFYVLSINKLPEYLLPTFANRPTSQALFSPAAKHVRKCVDISCFGDGRGMRGIQRPGTLVGYVEIKEDLLFRFPGIHARC